MSAPRIPGFYDAVKQALESISTERARDCYAVSFFIYDDEDDPRRPTLTIGYNTVQQWQRSVADASGSDEAKWNYAFWMQNELVALGRAGSSSADAVADWIRSLGLEYSDDDEDKDFKRCAANGELITAKFVTVACELASTVHADGVVERVFGRPIPIIVHELEYYDEIAKQTGRSNPPGLADEFIAWVRGL